MDLLDGLSNFDVNTLQTSFMRDFYLRVIIAVVAIPLFVLILLSDYHLKWILVALLLIVALAMLLEGTVIRKSETINVMAYRPYNFILFGLIMIGFVIIGWTLLATETAMKIPGIYSSYFYPLWALLIALVTAKAKKEIKEKLRQEKQ